MFGTSTPCMTFRRIGYSMAGVFTESGVDEDTGDEVQNVKDLELLQRLHLGNDSDDDVPDHDDYIDTRDSDDETYDPANPDYDDYF